MTIAPPTLAALGATAVLTILLVVVVWWRRPLTGPFAAYAGAMTLGSAVTVPGLPAPFDTLSTLLGLLAAASIAGFLLLSDGPHRPLHRSVAPFSLLLGMAALSTFWSLEPGRTVRSVTYLAAVMVLFGLVTALPVRARDVRVIDSAMILGGLATAGFAVWQLTQGGLGEETAIPRLATVGAEGGPNATSAALLLPLLVALARADAATSRTSRRLAVGAALLIAATVVFTGSRGGIAGALAALIVAAVVSPNRVRYLRLLVASAVAVALALTLAPSGLTDHLQKRDSTGRAQIWAVGVRACSTYCLTGSGYATFGGVYLNTLAHDPALEGHRLRPYQAHNFLLSQIVELGVVALALTVVALWWVVRDVARLPRRWRGPPLAAMVGLLVSNMFLSHFEFRYFWLVLTYAILNVSAHREVSDASPMTPGVPVSTSGGAS